MTPEIGDIIDCRQVPEVGHFVLSLGQRTRQGKEEAMYYMITSRVYAVFPKILDFFNECLDKNYGRFLVHFPKEKSKKGYGISLHGRLRDAFFLDKESDYNTCLDEDSMIVINENPRTADLDTLNRWHASGSAIHRNRLTRGDLVRFMDIIKSSNEISGEYRTNVCRNFNVYRRVCKP